MMLSCRFIKMGDCSNPTFLKQKKPGEDSSGFLIFQADLFYAFWSKLSGGLK